MNYDTQHYRNELDASCTAPEALDDRDEPGINIDEDDPFNDPADKVAHL